MAYVKTISNSEARGLTATGYVYGRYTTALSVAKVQAARHPSRAYYVVALGSGDYTVRYRSAGK